MSKPLKKYGLFLTVLIYISLVIFFLIRDHKKDFNTVLSSSLDFIGSKLNAMVPDSQDKDSVSVAYANFKQQVLDKKVPPELVESVAANILNLSKSGATVSPSLVGNILASEVTVTVSSDSLGFFEDISNAPKVSVTSKAQVDVKIEELEALGVRLSSIYNFEEIVNDAIKDSSNNDRELFRHMRYDSKNGLKIVVDQKTKESLKWKNLAKLEKEMDDLQKENILVYKLNYIDELGEEKKRLEAELKIIIEARKNQRDKRKNVNRKIRTWESLKKLEIISITGAMDPDSLKKIIKKFQAEADEIRRITVKARKDSSKR